MEEVFCVAKPKTLNFPPSLYSDTHSTMEERRATWPRQLLCSAAVSEGDLLQPGEWDFCSLERVLHILSLKVFLRAWERREALNILLC